MLCGVVEDVRAQVEALVWSNPRQAEGVEEQKWGLKVLKGDKNKE